MSEIPKDRKNARVVKNRSGVLINLKQSCWQCLVYILDKWDNRGTKILGGYI